MESDVLSLILPNGVLNSFCHNNKMSKGYKIIELADLARSWPFSQTKMAYHVVGKTAESFSYLLCLLFIKCLNSHSKG